MKQNYKLGGIYLEGGDSHNLAGTLHVLGDGRVHLSLVDEDSPVQARTASGRIFCAGGKMFLDFLVEVSGKTILNFSYHLEKTHRIVPEDYSGKWIGTWEPVEKEVAARGHGGAIDLPSGDSCYVVGCSKLVPREEDKRRQRAEIRLETV